MDIGVWVSVVATLVAIASAGISIHNSRLSVRPVLAVWLQHDAGDNFRYVLANKGKGPAIVDEISIFVDGKKSLLDEPNFRFIFQHLIMDVISYHYFQIDEEAYLEKGHPIGAGDEKNLVEFRVTNESARFDSMARERMLSRLKMVITYRDMFDEKREAIFTRHSSTTHRIWTEY